MLSIVGYNLFIDPTVYGKIARYVNRSFVRNCAFERYRFDGLDLPVVFIATMRYIPRGAELTVDYGWITGPFESQGIFECGAAACQGIHVVSVW